jgi:hypothetical protein
MVYNPGVRLCHFLEQCSYAHGFQLAADIFEPDKPLYVLIVKVSHPEQGIVIFRYLPQTEMTIFFNFNTD